MTQAHPLSWPFGWTRTAPAARQRAKFRKQTTEQYDSSEWKNGAWVPVKKFRTVDKQLTVAAALERLQRELDRLGVLDGDAVVSTNIPVRLDGLPRSNASEPSDPGVAVYFKLRGKDRVLACDRWDRVADNIAAIAAHIDAIRAQERYGVGSVEQAFAGYTALPAPGTIHKRPWRDVLGPIDQKQVAAGATLAEAVLELAERRYRQLARERHPDNGGSHEQMAELNAAIAEARAELAGSVAA